MKPNCYTMERVDNTWVALANGSKILSFDSEQIAIAATKDATVLLTAAKTLGRHPALHSLSLSNRPSAAQPRATAVA